MPTRDEAREQIGNIDGASSFLGRREIRTTPQLRIEYL